MTRVYDDYSWVMINASKHMYGFMALKQFAQKLLAFQCQTQQEICGHVVLLTAKHEQKPYPTENTRLT